jgi:UDP-N-acetylmuramoylalanine--D-glutamate ligase
MLTTAANFRGLPHRTQLVIERNGVRWYDDSKGTNVGATLAALQGIDSHVVLIAGGVGKDADFSPLRDIAEKKCRAVILMGRDAQLIEDALGGSVPVQRAESMEDAVRQAEHLAHSGDAVLLSPACASFDMFENYQERGNAFIRCVTELDS